MRRWCRPRGILFRNWQTSRRASTGSGSPRPPRPSAQASGPSWGETVKAALVHLDASGGSSEPSKPSGRRLSATSEPVSQERANSPNVYTAARKVGGYLPKCLRPRNRVRSRRGRGLGSRRLALWSFLSLEKPQYSYGLRISLKGDTAGLPPFPGPDRPQLS